MDVEQFKVLTLNCWGVFIPVFCEKRHERLSAIGDKLCEGYYDIILLQEIWTEEDFFKLKNKLSSIYPHSNYFYSNIIGSGCCIFTKFKILNTFFYRYPSNGYPHCFYHGDWFGGKGLGLASLEIGSRKYVINVYITHMHARYKHTEDEDTYSFHRLMQGYEASEFIRLTSSSCDAVIIGGDFNMDPSMLGLNFITVNSGVKDAWFHNTKAPSEYSLQEAATCDRPDNPYVNKKWQRHYPYGERLDYIFFRQNSCIKLICTDCSLTMKCVPNQDMHYSDHCGVEAKFEIVQNSLATSDSINQQERVSICEAALKKVDMELRRVKCNCVKDFIFFLVSLLCIIFDYPNSLIIFTVGGNGLPNYINRIFLVLMSMACFIFVWYCVSVRSSEKRVILNVKQSMEFVVKNSEKRKVSVNCDGGDLGCVVSSKDKLV